MINPHLPGLKAVRQDGRSAGLDALEGRRGREGGPVPVGDPDRARGAGRRLRPRRRRPVRGPGVDHQRARRPRRSTSSSSTPRPAGAWPRPATSGSSRSTTSTAMAAPRSCFSMAARLRLARWDGRGFVELWHGDGVEPLVRPLPSEGDLSRTSGGNAPVWRETPGSDLFLLRFPDGVSACRLAGSQVIRVKPVATHEALGNVDDGDPAAERVTWEGQAVVTRAVRPRSIATSHPPSRHTCRRRRSWRTWAGRGRILVRDASGQIARRPPERRAAQGADRRPLYEHFQTHVDPAGSGPTVCDMDGDGENEIVATLAGPDGKPFCAILDGEGKSSAGSTWNPGRALLNRGPTGSLGPGRGRWIVLRMFYGEGSYQGRRPLVVAFDGKTGRKLWARDHYASYGPNPVIFAAHLPDRRPRPRRRRRRRLARLLGELLRRHQRQGRSRPRGTRGPLRRDPRPLDGLQLSLAGEGPADGGARPAAQQLLFAGPRSPTYAASRIWHHGLTRDTAGTWGILADVNGDGVSEFLHAQPDGLIRCFDVSAPRSRCATCPTGTRSLDDPIPQGAIPAAGRSI